MLTRSNFYLEIRFAGERQCTGKPGGKNGNIWQRLVGKMGPESRRGPRRDKVQHRSTVPVEIMHVD